MADRDLRSAFLGRFDGHEAELVVEILLAAGIHAFTKLDPHEPSHSPYGPMTSDDGIVMVDAARLDEARRVVETELPEQLEAIEREMASLEATFDEQPERGDV